MTATPKRGSTIQRRLKINGELVILGADGRLSFDALQRRVVTSPAKAKHLVATAPSSYVAFDLLAIGGVDLRTQRWTVRRTRLFQLAAATHSGSSGSAQTSALTTSTRSRPDITSLAVYSNTCSILASWAAT